MNKFITNKYVGLIGACSIAISFVFWNLLLDSDSPFVYMISGPLYYSIILAKIYFLYRLWILPERPDLQLSPQNYLLTNQHLVILIFVANFMSNKATLYASEYLILIQLALLIPFGIAIMRFLSFDQEKSD